MLTVSPLLAGAALEAWTQAISPGWITAIMWPSIVVRRPFTLAFATRETPAEMVGTPESLRFNDIITAEWAISFTVGTAALVLAGPAASTAVTTVRAGFRARLKNESDLEVVAEAASGPEGVAVVEELHPDVVLMDLRMPGGDGVDATRAIVAGSSKTAVVIVTTYEADGDIVRAVEAGALGYLLKDTRQTSSSAVRAAARGEAILSPSVAARLVRTVRQPHRAPLSPREKSVLRPVADGRTNGEIGLDLFITEATAKTHLLRISTKLGVSDHTAAVTTAIDRGELT